MKKSIIALTLCMLMALTGCTGQVNNTVEEKNDVFDDSRIISLVSEEGTYTDLDGNEDEYSFNVPQISSKADNAQLINGDIAYLFGTIAEKQLAKVDSGEYMEYSYISYETYWNDSVLSLVISARDMTENGFYGVYNYDFATDSLLTNRELSTLAGVSYSALKDSLVYSAVNFYDDTFRAYWADNVTTDLYDPYYMERRVAGISDKKLDEDLKRLYLNDDGELMCVAELGCMAGSGWMFCNLPVEAYVEADEGSNLEEAVFNCVHAAIGSNGNTVTVWFDVEGEYSDSVLKSELFDQKFTVQGTYSNYEYIHIGNLGETFNPYLFLITEDGTVEYANILESLNNFGVVYCGGPLCQLDNVVEIKDSETEETEDALPLTVLALDAEGNEYNLQDMVNAAEYNYLYSITFQWGAEEGVSRMMGDTQATDLNMVISEEDGFAIGYYNFDDNISEEYFGKIINLGMTRDGLVYGIIAEGEGGTISSAVILNTEYDDNLDYLTVKTVGGTSIFGDVDPQDSRLVRTYG